MKPTVSLMQHFPARRQRDVPHRGIERRKHARVGRHLGAREPVEERRFAGVRVADQRDGGERNRLPLPALRAAAAANALQIVAQFLDAAVDSAAVGFQLRFARTARSDSSTQPRHLHATPGEPAAKDNSIAPAPPATGLRECGRAGRNMSRINCVRSRTLHSRARSMLRCCVGVNSESNSTTSAAEEATSPRSSSSFPEPMRVAASGAGRDWISVSSTRAPALSAKAFNSSMDSEAP